MTCSSVLIRTQFGQRVWREVTGQSTLGFGGVPVAEPAQTRDLTRRGARSTISLRSAPSTFDSTRISAVVAHQSHFIHFDDAVLSLPVVFLYTFFALNPPCVEPGAPTDRR